MRVINQPFGGQLGSCLIELMQDTAYCEMNIFVAFAKNSGVLRLKKSIEDFRSRGGVVKVWVGVDMGVTSYEALENLLAVVDSLSIVHSEAGQTFHPKIYNLKGASKEVLIVGSNNMTAGGLWTNFESASVIEFDVAAKHNEHLTEAMSEYKNALNSLGASCVEVGDQKQLEMLRDLGYLTREIVERLRKATKSKEMNNDKRIFGKGLLAKAPPLEASKVNNSVDDPLAIKSPLLQTQTIEKSVLWLETRRMTGGSRNILDLSMKSLVEQGDPTGTRFDCGDPESRFMRGAVEFFGLNPTDFSRSLNITINYEGEDYLGNEILFPGGDRANGTWRLQIKGVSRAGRKITDAFKGKEEFYLVNKLLAFKKIFDGYYSMDVFPEDQLDVFRRASTILARNGQSKSAKQLGII